MSTLYKTIPDNFEFSDYLTELKSVNRGKIKQLSGLIGMKVMPVDIYTFMTDPYYLGNYAGKTLRDCWKYSLTKMFPNELTTASSYIVLRGAIGCISGSSRIRLLNGEIRTIKDLYNSNPNGGFYVYSWDINNNTWKPGLVSGVYYTGTKKVCKVTYSDKDGNISSVTTTLDHKFLLVTGRYVEAKDLLANNNLQSYGISHKVISIEILPDPIDVYDMTVEDYHNYGICDDNDNLIFTHNTGKSFVSKIILAYDIYRLCCVEDPFGFFELLGDKMLMIKIFHVTKYRAQELVNEFWEWIYNEKVPFFSDELRNKDSILHKILLSPASTLKDIVGGDMLSVWFSEFNELAPDFASDVLSSAVQRITSRFMKCNNLFSHVILDSSDKEIGCPIDQFINKSAYARNALIFSYPKWVATPELFFHSGSFRVYAGDSEVNPHILADGEDTSKFDRDRIIDVPNELLPNYNENIEKALQETAGISLAATDRFLDPAIVDKYCTIDLSYDESIVVDYYDKSDVLIDQLQVAIDNLPRDKYLFGGLDLAVKDDLAGLSFGYVDEIKSRDFNGIEVQEAFYRVAISIGIGRYNNQETSINKIQDLIMRIHSLHPIKEFVTDQYQSTQLLQSLDQMKIPVRRISVDRDDRNMIAFKNALYSGHIKLPNSTILKRELKFLKHIGNKVDHPFINPDGTKGSKDLVDSMVRIIISMMDAGVSAMDIPSENTQLLTTQYNEIIDSLYEKQVQLRSIYNSMRGSF